jgi:hypothetical protein
MWDANGDGEGLVKDLVAAAAAIGCVAIARAGAERLAADGARQELGRQAVATHEG